MICFCFVVFCLDLVKEYFYSWREYKVILDRLNHVHGIKRSMRWLKLVLRKLGLKKRRPDDNHETVKAILRKLLRSSECLKGYRSVWKTLRDKYGVHVRRSVPQYINPHVSCMS